MCHKFFTGIGGNLFFDHFADAPPTHRFRSREVIYQFGGLAESRVGQSRGGTFVNKIGDVMIHFGPKEAEADARKVLIGIKMITDWVGVKSINTMLCSSLGTSCSEMKSLVDSIDSCRANMPLSVMTICERQISPLQK
jgi:hypothetical protein